MDTARLALDQADGRAFAPDEQAAGYLRAIALALIELQPEQRTNSDREEVEEGWYALELFGHRSRFGYVRTVQLAGRQMLEIREPAHPAGTYVEGEKEVAETIEVYAASAVFSITATSQERALQELAERDGIPF